MEHIPWGFEVGEAADRGSPPSKGPSTLAVLQSPSDRVWGLGFGV